MRSTMDAAQFDAFDCPPPDVLLATSCISTTPPTAVDEEVIYLRHLQTLKNKMRIAGVGQRCRHGVPQAFVADPGVKPLNSGLVRLSCPLLVQAIDQWEHDGAVTDFNEEAAGRPVEPSHPPLPYDLQRRHAQTQTASRPSNVPLADPPTPLARDLDDAHAGHAAARLHFLGEPRLRSLLHEHPAESKDGKRLRLVLSSGVAGQLRYKLDVKCLHAHVADSLCRNGGNKVGSLVLERLAERGVDIHGTVECQNQCSLCQSVEEAKKGWWYTAEKNKMGLRKRAERRETNTGRKRTQIHRQPLEQPSHEFEPELSVASVR